MRKAYDMAFILKNNVFLFLYNHLIVCLDFCRKCPFGQVMSHWGGRLSALTISALMSSVPDLAIEAV